MNSGTVFGGFSAFEATTTFNFRYAHSMTESGWDTKVRTRAFHWLDEVSLAYEDILPRALLQRGFELEGRRIPLVAPNGIFTPQGCSYPLSITTVLNGPYPDRFEDAHRLSYRYRGEDPNHRDNVGLRNAMRDNVPLVYFFAVAQGRYQAIKPVYVTSDDPKRLTFTIMADMAGTFEGVVTTASNTNYSQREYIHLDREKALLYIESLPDILAASYKHAQLDRAGTTVDMMRATYDISEVVQGMWLRLACAFPENHFGETVWAHLHRYWSPEQIAAELIEPHPNIVIPAKAGIQENILRTGYRPSPE